MEAYERAMKGFHTLVGVSRWGYINVYVYVYISIHLYICIIMCTCILQAGRAAGRVGWQVKWVAWIRQAVGAARLAKS